jgi:uncharacterized protein DUF6617
VIELKEYRILVNGYVETLAIKFCQLGESYQPSELVDGFDRKNERYTLIDQDPDTGDDKIIFRSFIAELNDHLELLLYDFYGKTADFNLNDKKQMNNEVGRLLTSLKQKTYREDYKEAIASALNVLKKYLSAQTVIDQASINSFGFKSNASKLKLVIESLCLKHNDGDVFNSDEVDKFITTLLSDDLNTIPFKIYFSCKTQVLSFLIWELRKHFEKGFIKKINDSQLFITNDGTTLTKKNIYKSKDSCPSAIEKEISLQCISLN